MVDTGISAQLNPEEATARTAAILAESEKEDLVLIEEPPDPSVNLPGGGVYVSGNWYDTAIVKELTGHAEEEMSRAQKANSTPRFIRAIVNNGVESIGPIENPDPDVLGRLLIGDRDMLIMQIRIVTYGPELELNGVQCPTCGTRLKISLDLSKDVPIRKMEDPTQRNFRVELHGGRIATLQLPTASIQDDVVDGGSDLTFAEMNTIMLSKTVLDVDGRPVLSVEHARGLSARDRRTLITFLTDHLPGPQFTEVSEDCPSCNATIPVPLDVADLFRM